MRILKQKSDVFLCYFVLKPQDVYLNGVLCWPGGFGGPGGGFGGPGGGFRTGRSSGKATAGTGAKKNHTQDHPNQFVRKIPPHLFLEACL